jgi:hypothetical protein
VTDELFLPSLGRESAAEVRRHYTRKMRRAMRAMAEALGIEHEDKQRYPDDEALWDAIKAAVAGGKLTSPQSAAPPVGDGFAIFVRGICTNHRTPREITLVHKCRGGLAYDEAEARDVVEYLKKEANIEGCDECHEPITTWHCEQNRLSVYAAAQP